MSTAPRTNGVRPSRSAARTLDEWTCLPERERSRLTAALREGENGERFLTICREIRFSPAHAWTVRKSISVHAEELGGLAEILEAVR